ncbi:MAG: diguanylate cyclase [Cellvibrionaceae bacterium]|nr:diguanylate cyclase [Cellvibrionaceae bacterium]
MNTIPILKPVLFEDLSLDQLQSPIWVYDVHNYRVYWANQAGLALWEAESLEELCGRDFSSDSSRAVQQTLLAYLEEFTQDAVIDRWWQISPKNIDKRVHCRCSGVTIEGKRGAMLIEGLDSHLLDDHPGNFSAVMLCLFDERGHITSSNPTFISQFGQLAGNIKQLLGPYTELEQLLSFEHLAGGHFEILLKTLQGERWHSFEVRKHIGEHVHAEDGNFSLTLLDIHERKIQALQHKAAAQTDLLTGLYNRRGLIEQMQTVGDRAFSLFYIDLDGFKPINDTYGHGAGDKVLKRIGEVLCYQIHEHSICARLGGDEFVLVVQGDNVDPAQLAQRIILNVCEPVELEQGQHLVVTASVGIASRSPQGPGLEQLLRYADAAMYSAKRRGRNRWVAYSSGMELQLLRNQHILQHMEEAVDKRQIEFNYQAIECLHRHRALYYVAQLSWQTERLGTVCSDELIEAMANANRLYLFERGLLAQLFEDYKHIQDASDNPVALVIKLPAPLILSPGFFSRCMQIIKSKGLWLHNIVFEINESHLVKVLLEEDRGGLMALAPLQQASAQGFHFAIGNFGALGAPLVHLPHLQLAYLKTSAEFLQQPDTSEAALHFIAELCERLGIDCVADGVISRRQSQLLQDHGIFLQQGDWFGEAQPLVY